MMKQLEDQFTAKARYTQVVGQSYLRTPLIPRNVYFTNRLKRYKYHSQKSSAKEHDRGIVVDTGAAISCVGTKQYSIFFKKLGKEMNMKNSPYRFKFGDVFI